ncbi:isoprenylcysteine carboxylmethyltransferase family protein [Nocardioides sp. Y6]|uniref:Isoprenylcysteine carboxylmethyltransferase family protein n=1 Tax=Nocardioides malaquae TaxID=2773426 RepID=A0ABR9RRT9_9ACTN|nr:isoprenylcysteine carboxylmethyltransferase family protein [Nocardioides malaquae]MBE7324281.1 isoprenylcysteine carboxylmethyltransferase family protein [Nocardioides malaquae]
MSAAALALFALYLLVAFGLRTWLQVRATGDSGFRGISGRTWSPEWWAGVLFVLALVAGLMGPVSALFGLQPVNSLDDATVAWAGVIVTVGGVGLTFATQTAMGSSWRIGVAEDEATALVTSGPFGLVRNPIFTAMALTGGGLVLMVPNLVALLGLVTLVVALELQVRVVEEPYLRRLHGAEYERYAASVGRFLPRLRALRDVVRGTALSPRRVPPPKRSTLER